MTLSMNFTRLVASLLVFLVANILNNSQFQPVSSLRLGAEQLITDETSSNEFGAAETKAKASENSTISSDDGTCACLKASETSDAAESESCESSDAAGSADSVFKESCDGNAALREKILAEAASWVGHGDYRTENAKAVFAENGMHDEDVSKYWNPEHIKHVRDVSIVNPGSIEKHVRYTSDILKTIGLSNTCWVMFPQDVILLARMKSNRERLLKDAAREICVYSDKIFIEEEETCEQSDALKGSKSSVIKYNPVFEDVASKFSELFLSVSDLVFKRLEAKETIMNCWAFCLLIYAQTETVQWSTVGTLYENLALIANSDRKLLKDPEQDIRITEAIKQHAPVYTVNDSIENTELLPSPGDMLFFKREFDRADWHAAIVKKIDVEKNEIEFFEIAYWKVNVRTSPLFHTPEYVEKMQGFLERLSFVKFCDIEQGLRKFDALDWIDPLVADGE